MDEDRVADHCYASANRKDFEDALKGILLAPRTNARSENREPTKAELNKRWRLERRRR